MKNDVLTKGAELEAAKARIHDMEQVVAKKDLNISELKRLMQRIKVCMLLNEYILQRIILSAIFRRTTRKIFIPQSLPTPPFWKLSTTWRPE